MNSWIDAGDLAGLSAALFYWFLIGAAGMGFLIWRYRGRFRHWLSLSARDRADGLLNLSLFGILLNAALQRGIATYSFAVAEWRLSPITVIAAPLYLVWSLIFMAGLLWWQCLEVFGPSRYHLWWHFFMVSGALLGIGVAWRF